VRRITRHTITAAATTGRALAATTLGPRALLRHTLTTARQVTITYRKENGETSTRIIEPREVRRSAAGDWYVRAWDHLRDAARTFRLDRISATA
jgi:predicted DNA-binding transcriptional regulator YafY